MPKRIISQKLKSPCTPNSDGINLQHFILYLTPSVRIFSTFQQSTKVKR